MKRVGRKIEARIANLRIQRAALRAAHGSSYTGYRSPPPPRVRVVAGSGESAPFLPSEVRESHLLASAMNRKQIRLVLALGVAALAGGAWLALRPARVRVVLIGFDGLDWAVVEPLVARGEMPNLARLRREGCSGPLRSMEPMLSPILWTTMATGKTADEHGIGWFGVENPNTHAFQPIQSTARKVEALWNIASDEDRTVGVVNWYASYPAEVVRGFVVTNYFGAHAFGMTGEGVRVSAGKTYPEALFDEVEAAYGEHASLPPEELARFASLESAELERLAALTGPARARDALALLHDTLAAADGTAAVTLALERRFEPDLLLAYFDLTDAAAHLFMRYRPPPLAWVDAGRQARFAGVVDEVYRRADRILGQILEEVGPRALVVVVSDHGFASGADRPAGDPERDVDPLSAADWHSLDGVICAAGPGVRAGHRVEGASILDVAPTLLYALGLPVARDMPGRPLLELFDEPFREAHPLERVASYEHEGRERAVAPAESDPEADAAIAEKLRALGYAGEEGEAASAEVHANLAWVSLNKGDTDEAIREYQLALAENASYVPALVGLGSILSQEGQFQKARELLETAVRLRPEDAGARAALGQMFLDSGQPERARQTFGQVLERDPGSVTALLGLGSSAEAAGDGAEAERRFREAVALDPKNARGQYSLGCALQARGALDEAARAYAAARELEPNHTWSHNNLGKLLSEQGKPEAAARELRRAVECDPSNVEAQYNLGTVELGLGRFEPAIVALRAALALKSDLTLARQNLAFAYLQKGDVVGALREYRALTQLHPEMADAWFQCARLLSAAGETAEAQRCLRRALELGGDELREAARADPVLDGLDDVPGDGAPR